MMNRREMLKRLGIGALALTVAPVLKAYASSDVPPAPSSWSSDPRAIQAAMLANYAQVRGLGYRDERWDGGFTDLFLPLLADAMYHPESHDCRVDYILVSEATWKRLRDEGTDLQELVDEHEKILWGAKVIHPPMMEGRHDVILVSLEGMTEDTLFADLPDEEINARVAFTLPFVLSTTQYEEIKEIFWGDFDQRVAEAFRG